MIENSSKLNKRGTGAWNKRGGWKILERGSYGIGVEEILFQMLKSNRKKLKCFGLVSLFKNNNFLNQIHSFRR